MEQEHKTVEQLSIRLTNIPLTCGYPRDQMDTTKAEVMFNATKYFK